MNTTSKASNAFEAFFGIHELPPPRILSSSLKAWKLHWHNPMTNIGIDIIGIRISQQRHGVSTTRTRLTQKKHVTPNSRSGICVCLSLTHSLFLFCISLSLPLFRHHQYISSRQNVYTKVTIVRTAPSIVTNGVPSLRDQIRPWWYQKNGEIRVYEILPPLLVEDAHSCVPDSVWCTKYNDALLSHLRRHSERNPQVCWNAIWHLQRYWISTIYVFLRIKIGRIVLFEYKSTFFFSNFVRHSIISPPTKNSIAIYITFRQETHMNTNVTRLAIEW